MITLWGVWDDNVSDWVAGAWTSDAELAERRAARWGAAYQALPASFVQVPPEVIAAAKQMQRQGGPDCTTEAESSVLDWIAQAVAGGGNA